MATSKIIVITGKTAQDALEQSTILFHSASQEANSMEAPTPALATLLQNLLSPILAIMW